MTLRLRKFPWNSSGKCRLERMAVAGQGRDAVYVTASYALAAANEIEYLYSYEPQGTAALNLSGNDFGQFIMGTDGGNVLRGFGGADTLDARGGFDQLFGGDGADILTGGARGDDLIGGAGADMFVYFDISENNYIKYKRQSNRISGSPATDFGARVEVGLPDESRYPHEARLDFLDNHLGHDTGTLTARAVVANPSGLLSPGLFARVRVTGSAPYTALLVSDEAIGTDQTGKFVYVVGENGSVIRRDIVLGPVQDGVRAVREGLAADDWVIVRGMQRVAPGDRATPRRE